LTETIAGDASFSTKSISFGGNARVEGTLHIYAKDPDSITVPDHVAPAERVVRHSEDEFDPGAQQEQGWGAWFADKLTSILVLTALATIVAALAPAFLVSLRARTLETPVRALWMGFLSISALAGSLFLFALTGFGILLVPASIVLAVLLGLAGSVIGTYILTGAGALIIRWFAPGFYTELR